MQWFSKINTGTKFKLENGLYKNEDIHKIPAAKDGIGDTLSEFIQVPLKTKPQNTIKQTET